MAAACEAILLAEVVALLKNEHLHTDATHCPDPAEHVVMIKHPERGVHLAIEVCGAHELLIASHTVGYQRSIRKHTVRT